MTLSPILSAPDATTVALDFGVFVAERAQTFRTSQTAIIAALRPIIAPDSATPIPSKAGGFKPNAADLSATPSQPPKASHAPAADTSTMPPVDEATDGAATASLPSEPSVAPIHEPAAPATNPVKPTGSPAKHAAEAPSSAAGMQDRCVSIPAPPSPTKRNPSIEADASRVLKCHADHPDWTSRMIGRALGMSHQRVTMLALPRGVTLPTQPEYDAALVKARTLELAGQLPKPAPAPETPPAATPEPATEAVEPPPAKPLSLGKRIAAFVADHPDATLKDVTDAMPGERMQSIGWAAQKAGIVLRKYTPEERSEVAIKAIAARDAKAVVTVANEPRRIVPTHAPRGAGTPTRFYVRDGQGRYVHQSLERSPTDDGPLMTVNRAYAWFDNAQRFEGARKLWPEIATMRKDAP